MDLFAVREIVSVFAAIAFANSLSACATGQRTFDEKLGAGSCEEAARSIPEERSFGLQLANQSLQIGGTFASYVYTGLGYTSEVVLDVAGTTTMVMVLCAPLIIAVASQSYGNTSTTGGTLCFPGPYDLLTTPPIGRAAFRDSAFLRCPRVEHISESTRKVATCFEKRNTPEGHEQAWKTLADFQRQPEIYRCLSSRESAEVNRQLSTLETARSSSGGAPYKSSDSSIGGEPQLDSRSAPVDSALDGEALDEE